MKFRLIENSFRRHSKWDDSIDRNITLPKSSNKSLSSKVENNYTVQDIILLSNAEANILPIEVKKFYGTWWLRSWGFAAPFAQCVSEDGTIHGIGSDVNLDSILVRPALIVSDITEFMSGSSSFDLYDEIKFKGIRWIIISDTMLLCNDTSFGKHRFDKYINDYNTSEIKEYIHEKAKDFRIL